MCAVQKTEEVVIVDVFLIEVGIQTISSNNRSRNLRKCTFRHVLAARFWSESSMSFDSQWSKISSCGQRRLIRPLRKHTYIILTPSNPVFIKSNWGLQGYTLFFLFLLKHIDCGYSLEPPRRGGSNEYPQSMCLSKNLKNIIFFLSEIFQFLEVKFLYIWIGMFS